MAHVIAISSIIGALRQIVKLFTALGLQEEKERTIG